MTEQDLWEGQTHPSEMVLADYLEHDLAVGDRSRVEAHLATCGSCRSIVEHAGEQLPAASASTPQSPAWSLPSALMEKLRERSVEPPAAGQLWRLRVPGGAGEITDLAVLTVVDDDLIIAVPATSDSPESSDVWTWQASVIGTDVMLGVWMSLETAIGWEALDVCLGSVAREDLLRIHRAIRRGQQPPADLPVGRPLDDELAAYRRQLQARFALFGDAHLLPDMDTESDDDVETVDVLQAMTTAGWDLGELVKVTGLTPVEARKVRQGLLPLSPEHLGLVQAALGVGPVTSARVHVDRGWAAEVARPAHRHRFEKVAAALGQDGWAIRAREALQPAAARGNQGSRADWTALVEQRLAQLEAAAGITD